MARGRKPIIQQPLTPRNVKAGIEFMKKTGQPFKLVVQTYTSQIIGPEGKFLYMDKSHSFSMFAAFNKIRRDILKFDAWAGNLIPDTRNAAYFEHKFTKDIFIPKVWNFDINSAYLCALFQCGMISKNTYEYCKQLKKADRLACVGMLASKKIIFNYNEFGQIEGDPELVNSETSKYFFWAVNYICDAMHETARFIEVKNTFLFYWVDGIYCVPIETEELFESFIFANLKRDFGLDCKLEKLQAFKVKKIGKTFRVNYFKDGKPKQFAFNFDSELQKFKSEILKLIQK